MKYINNIFKAVQCLSMLVLTFFVSCSGSDLDNPNNLEEEVYTFHIEMPERNTLTRASVSTNAAPTDLYWSVYELVEDEAGNVINRFHAGDKVADNAFRVSGSNYLASVSMTLAKGRKYEIAFFAKNSKNKVVTFEDGVMTVDYTHENAISNNLSAFTGKCKITQPSETEIPVTLTRKFSQVGWWSRNIKSGYGFGQQFKYDEDARKVLYKLTFNSPVYSTYNVLTEELGGKIESLSYEDRSLYSNDTFVEGSNSLPWNNEDYYCVCYNHILTDAVSQGTIDMELQFYHPNIEDYNITVKSNNIPVQQNYQTNIYGEFLTSTHIFGMSILNDFDDNLIGEITPPSDAE